MLEALRLWVARELELWGGDGGLNPAALVLKLSVDSHWSGVEWMAVASL